MGTFRETFKSEMAAQRAAKDRAKEERRKQRKAKGSLIFRIMMNTKSISIGAVYSLAYLLFAYCVIMFATLYLPSFLSVIVSYFEASSTFIISVECACLFFTAWIFVLSYVIVKKVTKFYIKGIRSLFHPEEK